jgi:hypothetical protein
MRIVFPILVIAWLNASDNEDGEGKIEETAASAKPAADEEGDVDDTDDVDDANNADVLQREPTDVEAEAEVRANQEAERQFIARALEAGFEEFDGDEEDMGDAWEDCDDVEEDDP